MPFIMFLWQSLGFSVSVTATYHLQPSHEAFGGDVDIVVRRSRLSRVLQYSVSTYSSRRLIYVTAATMTSEEDNLQSSVKFLE